MGSAMRSWNGWRLSLRRCGLGGYREGQRAHAVEFGALLTGWSGAGCSRGARP